MKIYLYQNEKESEPLSEDDIFRMLCEKSVTNEDWARLEDDTDWRPLSEVMESLILPNFDVSKLSATKLPSSYPPSSASGFSPSAPFQPSYSLEAQDRAESGSRRSKTDADSSGGGSAWMKLALLLLVVGAAVYGVKSGKLSEMLAQFNHRPEPLVKTVAQPVRHLPTPVAASAAPAATPVQKAVAAAAPVVYAAPTPRPFSLAELSADRASWPRTVVLKKAAKFPIVMNGRNVGSAKVPAGTVVRLDAIHGDGLVVEFQGNAQTIRADQTNLKSQIMAQRRKELAAAPSSSSSLARDSVSATPTGSSRNGSNNVSSSDQQLPGIGVQPESDFRR